ncbi:MAG: phage tail tape measure protein [Candidatus Hydrothermia bacterium]
MDFNLGRLVVHLDVDTSSLTVATAKFEDFAKKTANSIDRTAQKVRTMGYLMTAVFTVPLTAATKSLIKTSSDYEYELQKIVGLTDVAQEEVNEWNKSILKLSETFGKSPIELAQSLYFIASSGIKSSEALEVLRVSAMASASGLGSTKDVADLVTSVLNAYANTGITAAEVTDQLVAAVRVGKAEASEFASSIGQVIPIAAQLGVSFAEVAGGMAAITLQGASARTAGVYLKNVLNSLIKESGENSVIFEELGLNWSKLRSILKEQGLIALMNELRRITEEYDLSLFRDLLPDVRALTGGLALVGRNFEYNSKIIQEVINSQGDLAEAFSKVSDTLKIRLDRALTRIKAVMIDFGKNVAEAVIPLVEKFADVVRSITNKFNSWSDSTKKLVLIIGGLTIVSGPLLLYFSTLLYVTSNTIRIFGQLVKILKAFSIASITTKIVVLDIVAGLGALAGIIIGLSALIRSITKDQREFNKQLDDFLDKQEKLNKERKEQGLSLKEKYATIGEMNLRQLKDYTNELSQFIALLEDQKLVADEQFENLKTTDTFYKKLSDDVEKYKKIYEDLGEVIKKRPDVGLINAYGAISKYYQNAKNKLDEYTNSIIENKKAIDENLGEYKKMYENVKKMYEKMASSEEQIAKAAQDAADKIKKFKEIVENTTKSLQQADVLSPLMKSIFEEYDVLEAKKSAYQKAIQDITELFGDQAMVLTETKTAIEGYLFELRKISYMQMKPLVGKGVPGGIPEMAEIIKGMTARPKELTLASGLKINVTELAKMPQYAYDTAQGIREANNELNRQLYLIDVLAEAFTAFFENMDRGWKRMLRSFVRELERYVARILALTLIYTIAAVITGGGTKFGALVLTSLKSATGVFKGFAEGGVVPPGYPNDTYPALLSSGEVVFTPDQLRSLAGAATWAGEVRFEIEDDKLVGILRRYNLRRDLR